MFVLLKIWCIVERTHSYLVKETGKAIKIPKTKYCPEKVDIGILCLIVKGRVMIEQKYLKEV